MLARLIRKAKEREKNKRARDNQPTEHLEANSYWWVILPDETRDLADRGIVGVYVGPARPRRDTHLHIVYDDIRPQRNGPEYLDAGKGHQAEVPATTRTIRRRHKLVELTFTLEERVNGQDWSQ
jgi:hypothetical protein